MFRIGEFSRIARVTVDTLRHYDMLGLLTPVKVDPFTGYRYYSARQLQSLNRILTLKEVGFSLDEIARILQGQPTHDELQGMLKVQLARAENEIQIAQERHARILARLNLFNLEEDMPAYEVILKPVEELTVAAIREVVPSVEQMPQRCSIMFETIEGWLRAKNLPIGAAMTIYYNEGFVRENIDTECAFIISDASPLKAAKPESLISIRQIEAVPQMASTIVTDDFYKKVDSLTPAYTSLARWIENSGYRIVGPPRELFYGSVQDGDLTAEVQFPVERA